MHVVQQATSQRTQPFKQPIQYSDQMMYKVSPKIILYFLVVQLMAGRVQETLYIEKKKKKIFALVEVP